MEYPLISEYKEAILSAEDNFNELSSLRPVLDDYGNPIMSSGNFAVVFKMRDENDGKLYAVKCFIKDQEGRDESYRKIADELEMVSSSYVLPLRYLENELFVDNDHCSEEEFPVVVMEWIEGETLDAYLNRNLHDAYELEMLSYRFNRMAAWLLAQPFAHGDLKPDNILVRKDGSLVLVDYDGMFVPAMKGEKAREIGSPDYRHPSRTDTDFDEHIDDFSIAVIALSLKAIALNPILKTSVNSTEGLLLVASDFRDSANSAMLKKIISSSSDSELSLLLSAFFLALAKNSLDMISFRVFMTERTKRSSIQELSQSTTIEYENLPKSELIKEGHNFCDVSRDSLIESECIEFMPRRFANGLIAEYYQTIDEKIRVVFKDKIPPRIMESLVYIVKEFIPKCKKNGTYDFLIKHANLPLFISEQRKNKNIVISPYPNVLKFHKSSPFKASLREGMWCCSEKLRNKCLTPKQRGNLYQLLQCANKIATVMTILHDGSIIVDDCSYMSFLINPETEMVYLSAWDTLHKIDGMEYWIQPAPNFVAPELTANRSLYLYPTIYTNHHALAVLIYMILFHRHPLRGKKIHSLDPIEDEKLTMGEKALFIEHPENKSNEVNVSTLSKYELPYGDPHKRPYTLSGPYLKKLFMLAFVEALHIPHLRPSAYDWMVATDRTLNLLIPCSNPACEEKYFVYQKPYNGRCPYCGTKVSTSYPVLYLYSQKTENQFSYDIRIIGKDDTQLFKRHLYSSNDEKYASIVDEDVLLSLSRRGDRWIIKNHAIANLILCTGSKNRNCRIGEYLTLSQEMKISVNEPNGRLILIKFLNPCDI